VTAAATGVSMPTPADDDPTSIMRYMTTNEAGHVPIYVTGTTWSMMGISRFSRKNAQHFNFVAVARKTSSSPRLEPDIAFNRFKNCAEDVSVLDGDCGAL